MKELKTEFHKMEMPDFSPLAVAEAALVDALQQVKSLTAELAKETVRKEAAYANEQRLENDNLELRRRIFARFNEDECWIFQDDGHDYPESLVCPVVMSSEKLREFIRVRNAANRLSFGLVHDEQEWNPSTATSSAFSELQDVIAETPPAAWKAQRQAEGEAIMRLALELCDAVENNDNLSFVKFARRCGRLVNEIRQRAQEVDDA